LQSLSNSPTWTSSVLCLETSLEFVSLRFSRRPLSSGIVPSHSNGRNLRGSHRIRHWGHTAPRPSVTNHCSMHFNPNRWPHVREESWWSPDVDIPSRQIGHVVESEPSHVISELWKSRANS
jgi:hypothetical protein